MACEWFHVLPQKCHYYDEESTQELQFETAKQILTTKTLPINHHALVFQTVALVPTLQDFKILVFPQPKC